MIFLDIDGTLTDFGGKIPESAKKALTLAKQGRPPAGGLYRPEPLSDIRGDPVTAI